MAFIERGLGEASNVPQPVRQCAAERAGLEAKPRQIPAMLRDDRSVLLPLVRTVVTECARTYISSRAGPGLPPARSTAGPMTAAWQAFAAHVDQICAIDYNEGLRTEEAVEAEADSKHWSDDRAEAAIRYGWAKWQQQTARLVANLGTPPERGGLLARWRANVAARSRLYRAAGDAWMHGEGARADSIWARMLDLKKKADVWGQRFGLRVCTSN